MVQLKIVCLNLLTGKPNSGEAEKTAGNIDFNRKENSEISEWNFTLIM